MYSLALTILPAVLGGASAWVSRQGPFFERQRTSNIPCQPPGMAFSIVWPLLYLAMGRAFVITKSRVPWNHPALIWFGIQLALNLSWAPINTYIYHAELMWVLTGLVLAAATYAAILMSRVSNVAGLWMLPYLAWLTFALALSRNRVVIERNMYP